MIIALTFVLILTVSCIMLFSISDADKPGDTLKNALIIGVVIIVIGMMVGSAGTAGMMNP